MEKEIRQAVKLLKRILKDSTSSPWREPNKKWVVDGLEETSLRIVIDLLNDLI